MVAHAANERGDAMSAMIHIHGRPGGEFIVQFVAADGRSLAIAVDEKNAEVLRDFQECMPYGLAVPDIDPAAFEDREGEFGQRRARSQ
jgi:hypothetical protein